MIDIPTPHPDEYPDHYRQYIGHVKTQDVYSVLYQNAYAVPAFLLSIDDDKWSYRYAPDKWSIAQVVMHIIDCEQIFAYRALRIARGDQTVMPSFDQDQYAAHSNADHRTPRSIVDEYYQTRRATLSLIDGLDDEAAYRCGFVANHKVSFAAICHIIAGHEQHHIDILVSRYLDQSEWI